ncbi:MAG: hypothetical protein F2877_01380 [Actinobacteria bacterium]|nr:hypothetical protein [Actinomycetota bacterium]
MRGLAMRGQQGTPRPNMRARFLVRLCQTVVHVFMRRVDVTGSSHVPPDRPTIFISNHANGLADPVVLIGQLGTFPRFLVAQSLWRIRGLSLLLKFAMCVPVARRGEENPGQDNPAATNAVTNAATNASAFDTCHEVLHSGGRVCIFPEGGVHDNPRLALPLKTGTARIALEGLDSGSVDDLVIVPLGITYEERGRFRAQVALQIGEAIEVRDFLDSYRVDGPEAVRSLTHTLGEALAAVTRSHSSWLEAEVVHAAAEVTVLTRDPKARDSFAQQATLQRVIGEALSNDGGDQGRAFKGLEARVDDLRERLDALGTHTPADVVHLDPQHARRRIALLGVTSAALAPSGVAGYVLNALPASVSFGLGLRVKHPAWQATAKGGSALVTLPVTWGIEAWLAHRRWGRRGALVALLLGPITGVCAIAWTASIDELRRSVRASGWARRPEGLIAARLSRDNVIAEVERLESLTTSEEMSSH